MAGIDQEIGSRNHWTFPELGSLFAFLLEQTNDSVGSDKQRSLTDKTDPYPVSELVG
jgi:hypothetical protein